MRDLDHKIIVTKDDLLFAESGTFEPEGIVIIEGRGPSVENVALHIWRGVVAHTQTRFPGLGKEYLITVEIQETDNNFFIVEKKAVV